MIIHTAHVNARNNVIECPVCGEVSEQPYLNYGAKACYSCRAFFRRAHQKTKTPAFTCKRGAADGGLGDGDGVVGSCAITVKTRRSCQRCRYDRCLAAGMRPEFVMSDEQKRARFRNVATGSHQDCSGGLVAVAAEPNKRRRTKSLRSSNMNVGRYDLKGGVDVGDSVDGVRGVNGVGGVAGIDGVGGAVLEKAFVEVSKEPPWAPSSLQFTITFIDPSKIQDEKEKKDPQLFLPTSTEQTHKPKNAPRKVYLEQHAQNHLGNHLYFTTGRLPNASTSNSSSSVKDHDVTLAPDNSDKESEEMRFLNEFLLSRPDHISTSDSVGSNSSLEDVVIGGKSNCLGGDSNDDRMTGNNYHYVDENDEKLFSPEEDDSWQTIIHGRGGGDELSGDGSDISTPVPFGVDLLNLEDLLLSDQVSEGTSFLPAEVVMLQVGQIGYATCFLPYRMNCKSP